MPSNRSYLATPQSGKKTSTPKRSMKGVRATAKLAGRIAKYVPYVGPSVRAAQSAYAGYKYARKGYSNFKSFTKRTPPVVKKRRAGATFSKSAGFFKSDGMKANKLDNYMNNGVAYHLEHGNVITDATRNVVYVGHSTCPKRTVVRVAIGALLKLLFKKAGVKIKNWDLPILNGANIPARLELEYKVVDGSTLVRQAFPMPVTKTFTEIVADILFWLNTFTAINFPQQWMRIVYYHDIGVIGSSRLLAYDIDLTATTLDLFCTSHLKIQNRTVNTSSNDQADDVDNVPIYGRSYDVGYNGTTFRDYNQPLSAGSPQLRTDIDYGVMDYATTASDLGTTLYKEVALPTQFIGVTSHGKAHLDPGEIKTSKIDFATVITFNKLVSLYKSKSLDAGAIFFLGKTRIFGFEKMITAVAQTVENQYNLAIETDLKVGCICRTKDNHQTAMKSDFQIGPL